MLFYTYNLALINHHCLLGIYNIEKEILFFLQPSQYVVFFSLLESDSLFEHLLKLPPFRKPVRIRHTHPFFLLGLSASAKAVAR
jgi:hypothetical protein